MQGLRAIQPETRLRMWTYSDPRYGEVCAILTDDDPLGKLCVLRGVDGDLAALVASEAAPGFLQLADGRILPRARLRGVLLCAVRTEGGTP